MRLRFKTSFTTATGFDWEYGAFTSFYVHTIPYTHEEDEFTVYYRMLTNKLLPEMNATEVFQYLGNAITSNMLDAQGRVLGDYYNRMPKDKQLKHIVEFKKLRGMLDTSSGADPRVIKQVLQKSK